jgi:hypothetical protein
MMEAIRSSETSVLTKNTGRKIPEDCFLQISISLEINFVPGKVVEGAAHKFGEFILL